MSNKNILNTNKLFCGLNGYTLVELLMVVSIFTVLALLTTMSLGMVLKSSKKSDSLVRVRSDIDYAMGVIEKNIRNAKSISCPSYSRVDYVSEFSNSTYFECSGGTNGYIASGSARLTSSDVLIDCTNTIFTCSAGLVQKLEINLTGSYAGASNIEGAQISSQTQVVLRNYMRR